MAHTKAEILVHMVFATQDRKPIIVGDFKPDLHAYMAGTVRGLGVFLHALGGVEDHCHLVFDLPPKLALASFADQLKSSTSRWAGANGCRGFKWQRGYGAFSVNHANLDRAVQYVLAQEAHHRKQTFRDELAEFLRVHGMEADSEFIDGVFTPDSAALPRCVGAPRPMAKAGLRASPGTCDRDGGDPSAILTLPNCRAPYWRV